MTTPPLTTLWLIIIVILSSSTNCFSIFISNLTSSQPLSLNQTLVSCNHVFELGFFTPNNTSTNQYLGIWYKGHDSPRSVAWVANREHPLSLTSSTSLAVLQINNNGNLELIQHEELQNSSSTIWSTNVDLRSNRTSSSTLGLLLDNGNFVLRDVTSGENLWESFKNPCDTFFPGSVLGFNLKTGEDYKLTSWKNENDPSPGNFIFEIIKKTLPEIVISINNGSSSTIYSRSGPWNKLKFTSNGNPTIYSSYRTPFNLVENVEQGTTYLKTNDEFTNSVLFLSPNGTVMVVMKDKANYGKISYQGPSACNFYGRCGPFGACQRTESPLCKCLRGFKPKSQQEWNKGNWSGGCVRESELFCDKNDDYFELISNIRIPDMYVLVQVASNNLDTCHKWCMNNCSCIAYSFIDAVGCMVWRNTPLIDIRILESDDANDLYFRIAASSELQGKIICYF
uniref:S-locus glycoprotein n=1 Tax=Cannabis sativa TaxID=3483 RepID=A0A803PKH0_CANSA